MNTKADYLKFAIFLAMVSVVYNVIEGLVSVYFGLEDGTLVLFGFGLDSFVEVISGIGIWHMILRIQKNEEEHKDNFEKTALKVTGSSFYLLAVGIFITSVYNIINGSTPETTLWGVIISSISILVMWWLIYNKKKVGKVLHSDAIIADANCTKVCMQLSFVLLLASIGYEVFGIGSIDALGSLIISVISYKEGKEAFEKANNRSDCC